MEQLNLVGSDVHVVKCSTVGTEVLKHTFEEAFDDTIRHNVGVDVLETDPFCAPEDSDTLALQESFRVSALEVKVIEFYLQSLLLREEILEKYKVCHFVKKELRDISLDDHVWNLKLVDINGVAVVKLHYGECDKDFGGSSREHTKSTINNLFANFKKSHIMSNAHIWAWCTRKRIPWAEHPQSTAGKGKTLILTAEDHKVAVMEGPQKLERINNDVSVSAATFVCIGDPLQDNIRSFWVKVCCKICGDMFQLCLPKKNLEINLTNHLMSTKHMHKLEDSIASFTSFGSLSLRVAKGDLLGVEAL